MDVDEAVDLIRTLPDGSLYVRRTQPERAWPEYRHALADVQDTLLQLLVAGESPHVMRPAERVERARAAKRSRASAERVRRHINDTRWEEA